MKQLNFLCLCSLVLCMTAASLIAAGPSPTPSVPYLDEAEAKFAEYIGEYVKGTTDTSAFFKVEVSAMQWEMPRNREYAVDAKQERVYARFVVLSRPLTKAEELNGVEFLGVAQMETDAVRMTAVEGSDAASLRVVQGKNPELDGKWFLPRRTEQELFSVQRVKGKWTITEGNRGGNGEIQPLRVHWLCGKPRPAAVPVDEAAQKAECLAAFEKLKHATSEGGFTLRYRGYDQFNAKQVHELLVEYRAVGAPVVARWEMPGERELTAVERLNGLVARYQVRLRGGASVNKESFKRELRAGEAKPHTPCTSPGATVTGEWTEQLPQFKAEQQDGVWVFSDGAGELVAEP